MTMRSGIQVLGTPLLCLFGNARQRYEARHLLLSRIVRLNGFRLYNRNLAWLNDQDYRRVWTSFPYGGAYIHERKFNLYSIAKSTRHIPGDIAECGVFKGGSSYLMLAATEGTAKHLHGFDSFEGLSEPTGVDRSAAKRTFKWRRNDMAVGEDVAAAGLEAHRGRFTLYKGWIPERFDEVDGRRFSLVHIDVDLYEPTLAALVFFYPRMSPGGIIVCDDYGFESCPGARMAMDEFLAPKPESSVIHLTTGQGMVIRHGERAAAADG